MSNDELELLAPWNEIVKAEIERRANESNHHMWIVKVLWLLKSSRGFFLSDLKIKRLPYIQNGSEAVVKEYPDRREYAVWEEVLNACLKEKYI